MRKNNLMVILLLITMVVTVVLNVSYADYEEDYIYPKCPSDLYVDPEYTTIYENDTINVNLGCDGDCDFKIGESKTVEIMFDESIFELELDEIKSSRTGIEYLNYSNKTSNGNSIYKINYKVTNEYKNYRKYVDQCGIGSDDEYGMYDFENDNIIDDIVFTGLKLKVKEGINLGTYKLNDLPITIIKEGNTINAIDNYEEKDDYLYTSCTTKCKINGIGERRVIGYDGGAMSFPQISVLFEDGTKADIKDNDYIYTKGSVNYNTVYKNDVIDLTINRGDLNKFHIEKKYETNEYQKYDNGNYIVNPVYIAFEKTSFDIDFSKMKIENDNITLKNIDKYEKYNYIVYIINLESKYLYTDSNKSEKLITNIKLKVKPTAEIGKNLLMIHKPYDRINKYKVSDIEGSIVINVIENKNNDKSLNKIELYDGSFGLSGRVVNIYPEKNKNIFTYRESLDESRNELNFEYVNFICNQRCLWRYYYENADYGTDFEVIFEDGTKEKYEVKLSEAEQVDGILENAFSYLESNDVITVIGNDKNPSKDVYNFMNQMLIKNDYKKFDNNYYEAYYYNYDELTNQQKEQLKYEFDLEIEEINFPYVIMTYEGEDYDTQIKVMRKKSEKEDLVEFVKSIYPESNINFEFEYIDKISTSTDENIIQNKPEEKTNSFLIIYLVTGAITLILVILIIIIIVKKHKSKKQSKALEQNLEINSSQVQEEQNKTLE